MLALEKLDFIHTNVHDNIYIFSFKHILTNCCLFLNDKICRISLFAHKILNEYRCVNFSLAILSLVLMLRRMVTFENYD